ncbi:MAG: rhomboid family intramembrane serine protease, partial [Desulfurococcales archaeon ex4484_58]
MFLPIRISAPHRTPYVTFTLIAINVIVFALIMTNPSSIVPGAIDYYDAQRRLAIVPASIVRGENLWTLITAMFVHADIFHLIGNMLFLFFFGGSVESAMGYRNYLVFYILCGLSATLFHILSITFVPTEYLFTTYTLNPWVTPVLGASGAISGVLGAYLIYYPRSRITFVYPV